MKNREIKFRAWDEQNKIMHNDFQFMKSGNDGNDWIVFVSDKKTDYEESITDPFFAQQLHIMQFTGLHDKNGKEIYEGDVVKIDWGNTYDIQEVVFDQGMFSVNNIPLSVHSSPSDEGLPECEIIGNIHESPELL